MKGAFMQAQQLLQQRFLGMEVVGSTYPVPATKQALAQGLGLVQMGGFGFVIFGEKLFEFMGCAAPPELYVQHVAGNKFGVGVGIWFVGNFLQNQLLSTGAFEVYYDGTLVFSKLAQGRMPAVEELLSAVESQMAARLPGDEVPIQFDTELHTQ
ncbi:hypothetical protein COO60DRAFT_1482516 [Scenedesmus sp. NREL 46B-D3]|nr:hypothetical protein COO60DRAFT_1482516 [Scenedesmus sp. NREL 46B-D3]